MVQVAYQFPLKEPVMVLSDTRSVRPLHINAQSLGLSGHNFSETLDTTVSNFALRAPTNDNSALLAALNQRIRDNPRIQAAQQASDAPDTAADAQPATALTVGDAALEPLQPVSPVLSAVERTEIELAETVGFIRELRASRLMSKADAKQFLTFAAQQAALGVVGEAAAPQDDAALTAADNNAHAIPMNPLALQALASQFGKIMPLAAITPKAAFQQNSLGLTDVQPQGLAMPQAAPVAAGLQAELTAIARDSQFNPDLVRRVHELQNPLAGINPQEAAAPHSQPQPLPVALPRKTNEDKILGLIGDAKKEQAAAEKLKLEAHVNNYMRPRTLEVSFAEGGQAAIRIDRAMVDTNLHKTIDDKPDMSLADRRIETETYKQTISRNYDETFNKQADMLMNHQSITGIDVRDGVNHNITHTAKADGTPILYELNSNASDIAHDKAKDPVVRQLNALSPHSGLAAA